MTALAIRWCVSRAQGMSIHMHIRMSNHTSAHMSNRTSIHMSIHMSIHTSIHMSIQRGRTVLAHKSNHSGADR